MESDMAIKRKMAIFLHSVLSFNALFLPMGLVSGAVLLTACSSDVQQQQQVAKGSLVIALGDSLTYGYGATPDTAYPHILSQLSGWNVKNEGINGNTTADILQRLDGIIAQKPKLVLLGIGGNDVLRRVPSKTTEDNLNQIISRLKQANIPVILIAEPHLSMSALVGKASDNPIYEPIAKSQQVLLFADEWSRILSDKSLKSDEIHANAQGYRQFAENLYQFLQNKGVASK